MKYLLATLLLVSSAWAQEQKYFPPDQEIWNQMVTAIHSVSMPLPAHQQIQQILLNVQQAAQQRAEKK